MGIGKHLKAVKFGPPGYIGFRTANTYHRVDLEPGTRPLTIFISGPLV